MRKYTLVFLSLFHISSVFGQEKLHFEFGMDSLIMNIDDLICVGAVDNIVVLQCT